MTRTVGGLGMSVGTSYAIENGGGDAMRGVDTVMFNLRTLIRNAQQSYESTDPDYNKVSQIVKDVENDLVELGKFIEKNRKGRPISMVVYAPSYKGIKSKFKHADLYVPKPGSKQEAFLAVGQKVFDELVKKYEKLLVKTDVGMPSFSGKGIVLTHHVVDLTEVSGIGRLYLLESHTGSVKPFTLWNTKLTGGDNLHYIPFNRLTIQVFGDRSTNFKSSSHGIKELVKKIAVEGKWTSATSMSRVRSTINSLPPGVDRSGLLMML
jgi:hypothetical protein